MTSYGHIDQVRSENESIEAYLERVDIYFKANEISDEKKLSIFLIVVGGKIYSLLRDLLAPVNRKRNPLTNLRVN